jgi:hypothetical protein
MASASHGAGREPSDEIGGEVLFEFIAMGSAIKVSAVHVPTNTEVSVMGSSATSHYSLKVNALRKLRAALQRNARH